MLTSAYTFLFQKQRTEETNILSEAVSSKKESSYAFLTYTILKLFYHIRVSNDTNALTEYKLLLDRYCYALSDYEKSVYYSLLALFYKRDISKAKTAHECLILSYSYCSNNSIVFAMNAFQEIAILGTKAGILDHSMTEMKALLFSSQLSQNKSSYFCINMLYFDTLPWYNICRK